MWSANDFKFKVKFVTKDCMTLIDQVTVQEGEQAQSSAYTANRNGVSSQQGIRFPSSFAPLGRKKIGNWNLT